MKSELAKARDKWMQGEDGKECCNREASGQYLRNRIERAFIAGWTACGDACALLDAKDSELKAKDEEIEKLKEEKALLYKLATWAWSCRRNNTAGWMAGLEERLEAVKHIEREQALKDKP